MAFHCHVTRAGTMPNQERSEAQKKLIITSVICLVFMIGEGIGGYAAHSQAVMTDAAHLLTDLGSILISVFSIWISNKPASKNLTFGWHHAVSILKTSKLQRRLFKLAIYALMTTLHIALGFAIGILSIRLMWKPPENSFSSLEAFFRVAEHLLTALLSLCGPAHPKYSEIGFRLRDCGEILGALLSVMSIWTVTVVLLFTAIERIITNDYEIHSRVMLITSGCAVVVNVLMALILHQSPVSHGHCHNHSNTSMRATFIHVLGDLFQSVGVFLAATIIYFWPEWKIADPICTFMFSGIVFVTMFTILKDIFRILMEDEQCNPHVALKNLTNLLQVEFGFHNITIKIEAHSSEMTDCDECQNTMD